METAISFVRSTGLIPRMLSKSRFNRRMHKTGELLAELFFHTGEAVKSLNISSAYCIDSFPVAVCRNIRIAGCRIVTGREYRGCNASKRTCFYGFKVHTVVTADGIPAEYTFNDPEGFGQMPLSLQMRIKFILMSIIVDVWSVNFILTRVIVDMRRVIFTLARVIVLMRRVVVDMPYFAQLQVKETVLILPLNFDYLSKSS